MARTARTKAPRRTAVPERTGEVVTLEVLEMRLGRGRGTRPSDSVFVRETARVLRAMDGRGTVAIPTLVCERGANGLRIVDGREALQVARELRARARWRGDETWAMLMGRRISFRVVTTAAGGAQAAPARRRLFQRDRPRVGVGA